MSHKSNSTIHAPRAHHPRLGVAHSLGLLIVAAAWAGLADRAAAKDAETLRTRALAATCAQCHGTDGRAVEGEALIRLAGLPHDYTLAQLMAFRTGQRPATIMHQITRGYSQEQLEALAKYFAAQK